MRDERRQPPVLLSSLIPHPSSLSRAVSFCCTFPILRPAWWRSSDGGYYPPPRPGEPGLSSPRLLLGLLPRLAGQRPSGRPVNYLSLYQVGGGPASLSWTGAVSPRIIRDNGRVTGVRAGLRKEQVVRMASR